MFSNIVRDTLKCDAPQTTVLRHTSLRFPHEHTPTDTRNYTASIRVLFLSSSLPITNDNDHDRCLMSLAPLSTDGRRDLLPLLPCLVSLPTSPILSSPFRSPSASASICNRRGRAFNAGNDCICPSRDRRVVLERSTIGNWRSCSLGIAPGNKRTAYD
jgi:hypothetical protein